MKKLYLMIFPLMLLGFGCKNNVLPTNETVVSSRPNLETSMSIITFGEVPVLSTGNDQALKIKNSGAGELMIESIQTTGDFSAKLAFDRSLTAGDFDYLVVSFAPTTSGTLTGTLTIKPVDADPKIINLTGIGLSTALFVSPKTINFGSVIWSVPTDLIEDTGENEVAHSVITVKNIGSKTITDLKITYPVEPVATFAQTNTCKNSLEAGETCFVTVTFIPSSAGDFIGKFFISASSTPTVTITLNGTATQDPNATPLTDALPTL